MILSLLPQIDCIVKLDLILQFRFNQLAIKFYSYYSHTIAALKVVYLFIKFVFLKSFKCRSLFGVSPFNVSLARIHFAFGGVYDFADGVGLSKA